MTLGERDYILAAWAVLDCDSPHFAALVGNPNSEYRIEPLYVREWSPELSALAKISAAVTERVVGEVRCVVFKGARGFR